MLVESPNECIRDAFDNNDSSQPAVEEVECIERDPEDLYKMVISGRKKKERHHVHDCQMSSLAANLRQKSRHWPIVVKQAEVDDI